MSVTTLAPPAQRGPSPRQRAKRRRLIQYVVLVVAIVGLLLVADWQQIGQVFFRSDMIYATLTQGLGTALLNTIIYSAGAFIFGLVGGTIPLDRWYLYRVVPRPAGSHRATRVRPAAAGLFRPDYSLRPLRHRVACARHSRCRLHGRDHPSRHPGSSEGPGRGGSLARYAGRGGESEDRASASVSDRHSSIDQ